MDDQMRLHSSLHRLHTDPLAINYGFGGGYEIRSATFFPAWFIGQEFKNLVLGELGYVVADI
jgi:hypothetical protein